MENLGVGLPAPKPSNQGCKKCIKGFVVREIIRAESEWIWQHRCVNCGDITFEQDITMIGPANRLRNRRRKTYNRKGGFWL